MTNVEFSTLSGSNILLRTFHGTITKDDILKSWEYIFEHDILKPDHIGVITDYRQATLNVGPNDLEEIKRHYMEHRKYLQNKKLAQVIDSSKVAIPLLFQHRNKSLETRPFSTLEAAIDWVLS